LFALFQTWMPATSSAKTRFALLRGHDGCRVAASWIASSFHSSQ
jgi:hypothetical protein